MPRISKTPMQLYREKLAKGLEERMPFMDSPDARDYFRRRAQRDWNEWVKQEALKRKMPRY